MASRLVAATDNSIYQVLPAAVLYPREGEDINRVVRAARSDPERPVSLSPRGGGTGTNGQSLTRGVIVDVSRHLNRIVSLDVAGRTVVVEPGVVLDQLNDYLKPHGLFFPPTVSTATRATIGGMVATDASGKGSRIYGKTSDYIESLDVVLSDGSDHRAQRLTAAELDEMLKGEGLAADIHREVLRVVTQNASLIDEIFPRMNRGLTGYNLKNVRRDDGGFDLAYLLAGSEGTLAFTKSITLRLIQRPKLRALVVARYGSFDAALRDVRHLLAAEPSAIEILDDKVLAVARTDVIWTGIAAVLGQAGSPDGMAVEGLNFIEFVSDDPDELRQRTDAAESILRTSMHPASDWTVVHDPGVISQLWMLREKSVGLLGRLPGRRQGTAFVEDTAVPPERLADYVAEFRAVLDRHGLSYGMFGHADVGCLHVRPALDMTLPEDAALIRPVSDEVAALTKAYGGLLWGEHGRGYRGEYSPFFFGPVLYAELCRIKTVFDPLNLLNPGKLASSDGRVPVDRIDAVPLRGEFDRVLDFEHRRDFDRAVACNGNAACHTWDASDAMCPSYKATRDRVQSPKGRATLLRTWAQLKSRESRGEAIGAELAEIESQTKLSLDTCLSCKACASQCPVRVDIPAMKSRFLTAYYRTRTRPARDRLVSHLEGMIGIARKLPRASNAVLRAPIVKRLVSRVLGLVDLPEFSTSSGIQGRIAPPNVIARLPEEIRARTVIVLHDSFLGSFDTDVIEAACRLLERLGYHVHVTPFTASGKAQDVLGISNRFVETAERATRMRKAYASLGVPMVSLDAATGLLFEQEYARCLPTDAAPRPVPGIERFLLDEIEAGRIGRKDARGGEAFRILLHCTERTARPETAAIWQRVFAHFGLEAATPSVGCCGMAGLFGHQVEHAATSRRLFVMSWRERIEAVNRDRVLATGFSCRCQVKRLAGRRPRHPIEAILACLEGHA
ncbi:FAD-binding and (Fe-S)-binding domain-containing protein [Microvirga brassicacearum]|nr:FAD-binding and (Fe-S)-binding domain-containing protein [Microvirga brassicacearum]